MSKSSKSLDQDGPCRRVFETPAYNGANRFVVKRTVPESQLENTPTLDRIDKRNPAMLQNEIRAIQYVRQHTTIPVPTIVTTFQDRDSLYMIQEYVEGAVAASSIRLPKPAKQHIVSQLESYVAQLHALTDPNFRSFVGAPFFPFRYYPNRLPLEYATYSIGTSDKPYVLCHGDLGWQNVLIDPITYDIKCIIDWEYAGFYPVEMESEDWREQVPDVAWGQGNEREREDEAVVRKLYASAGRMRDVPADDERKGEPEQVLDQNAFTPSQSRIRQLDIGFPTGRTISRASLATQTTIAAHQGIADDLDSLSKIMEDGHATLVDMIYNLGGYERPRPGDRPINTLVDHKLLTPLTACLPPAFTELSTAYRSAASPLIPLRDHLIDFTESQLALDETHKLPTLTQARAIRQASFRKWDEEQKRQEPIIEARKKEEVGVRVAADQGLQAFETAKWTAIRRFAERLLYLSHAAETLLPFMPDISATPWTREKNRDRYVAEQRVHSISQGGTGGWMVSVTDDGAISERIKKQAGNIWDVYDKANTKQMLM